MHCWTVNRHQGCGAVGGRGRIAGGPADTQSGPRGLGRGVGVDRGGRVPERFEGIRFPSCSPGPGRILRQRSMGSGGANAILHRDAQAAALVAPIHAVLSGVIVVTPGLRSVTTMRSGGTQPTLLDPLTARELEVLCLPADGLSNKLISERLTISDHTVKFHVNSILRKLGAQGRTEAVSVAIRMGLVQL